MDIAKTGNLAPNPENTGEEQVLREKNGRFVSGVSGNPKGKPLGTKHLSSQLLALMFEKSKGSKDTHGTLLNKCVIKKAIRDGDMRAIELIYDRIEGKAAQSIDVTSDGRGIVVSKEHEAQANEALQKFMDGYETGKITSLEINPNK